MKANKVPENIYVSTDPFGFLHAYDCENHPPIVEEYVHKDAFIEKACKAFCKVCKMPNCGGKDCSYLKDFKTHIKEE